MVNRRLPKALAPNPKPFIDSTGMMNVPESVSRMRADGSVIDPVARSEGLKPNRVIKRALKTKRPNVFISKRNGGKGFKAGKREGMRLTDRSRKRATRLKI